MVVNIVLLHMKKSPNQNAGCSLNSKKPAKKAESNKVAEKTGAEPSPPSPPGRGGNAAKTAAGRKSPSGRSATRAAQPAAGAAHTVPNGKESFFREVFRLVRQVPKGRVTSYGDIANAAQARITARMVGWAMHAAGTARPPVPAHRVVNSSGVLSGKQAFPTPTLMEELLAREGVTVKNNKVQNFAKLRWAPPPAPNKHMPVHKSPK